MLRCMINNFTKKGLQTKKKEIVLNYPLKKYLPVSVRITGVWALI